MLHKSKTANKPNLGTTNDKGKENLEKKMNLEVKQEEKYLDSS